MMQFFKVLCGMLFAALMTACGGGGGSPGVTPGAPVTPVSQVADFAVLLDKSTLSNAGTATAKLTVIAVDANNNVVAGAPVSVSTDAGSIFTPGSSVTNAQGQFTGQIGIGPDKSDREITATVTVNGKSKTTAIKVIGSKITMQATPSAPTPGQTATLTATVLDSGGNPVVGIPVKLGGTVPGLQNQTVTTDFNGVATAAFAAPTAPGVYTISASGSGVTASDYQLQVFSSSVPVANIPAGAVPSLSASPNVLAVNAPGSTSSKSTLRFLFLDAANNPIQNVRVRFADATTGLAAVGASIANAGTLYTDASGTVTTQYTAGQNTSPTNGVTVKACYSANDLPGTGCPAGAAFVTASMTVAGQALAISIGDDNVLEPSSGTYIKRFAVTVADSAGRAVPNASVDISVDLTHYGKGNFNAPYMSGTTTVSDLSVVPLDLNAAYPSATTVPSVKGERVWCANEDHNRNGSVDPLENLNQSRDANGAETLEPRKSDLLVSYDGATTTNANGLLIIKVQYSQRFGTWLAYRVRVTANVAGSQGMAERLFITDVLAIDVPNGSFLEAPYGFGSCSMPN